MQRKYYTNYTILGATTSVVHAQNKSLPHFPLVRATVQRARNDVPNRCFCPYFQSLIPFVLADPTAVNVWVLPSSCFFLPSAFSSLHGSLSSAYLAGDGGFTTGISAGRQLCVWTSLGNLGWYPFNTHTRRLQPHQKGR